VYAVTGVGFEPIPVKYIPTYMADYYSEYIAYQIYSNILSSHNGSTTDDETKNKPKVESDELTSPIIAVS
jgi:hypothetical protein